VANWGCMLGLIFTGCISLAGGDFCYEAELSVSANKQAETFIASGSDLPREIGEELWDELELDEMDELVEELLPGSRIKFTDVVIQMITGETKGIGNAFLGYIKERVGYELQESRSNLIQLLFLAAMGAVFSQLAAGFGSFTVSETGFHLTYLMMFGLLMGSFSLAYQMVSQAMAAMIRLLQAALPILFVAVAFSGKVTTSVVFSEMSTLVITGMEWMNQMILLPGTKLFLLLTLADNLSTSKNYVLDASAVALGLASNERVTEVMFVFGQAPAGFAQVEKPYIHCTAVDSLPAGSFVNVADVGGVYNGQWVQAVSRWVTAVYGKTPVLPRTGY